MLEEIDLEWSPVAAGSPEGTFIQDAQRRIEIFQSENERIPGFECSNFYAAAGVLQAVRDQRMAPGPRFCEWGSGFGVVACLAGMAGFDAWGIEAEANLVGSSRQLARDYQLGVQFHQGSYKTDLSGEPEPEPPTEKDLPEPSFFNCDVVYIYPWPAETACITQRFEQLAPPGALLISYKGGGRFRIQRKPEKAGTPIN
jgi:hypothetical protein